MAGYQMPTDEGLITKQPAASTGYNPGANMTVRSPLTTGDATNQDIPYAQQWKLENDPVYQQAMLGGQASFNTARANAFANLEDQKTASNRKLSNMKMQAQSARRNLAGNFAARGMMGGARGAYYRAQDTANAADIAAQTDVKDQLASLNRSFLQNFGDVADKSFDWTGTATGQEYKNQAIQQALSSILARYGAA